MGERNAYMRAWNAKHKERLKPVRKRLRDYDVFRTLIHKAKGRAKRKGIPFNLIRSDFPTAPPSHCPVLGLPIVYGGRKQTDNSPTLERIDNAKGYIKENTILVCWRANNLKHDATLEELKALVKFYEPLLS